MIYYDDRNNRLVYINKKASPRYWDSHWNRYEVQKAIKTVIFNRLIMGPSKKYLPGGGRILEGGCGLGQNVWVLARHGYDTYGVDYADETVRKVKDALPELKVSCGDVRDLFFEDNYFDGYWSLGVIEHFYNGFGAIAGEMKRVLKPGGYLFLTFPCMSKFREKKAGQGKYSLWKEDDTLLSDFYQFALSAEAVKVEFLDKGFELVKSVPLSGLKGFKDEIEFQSLKRILQALYDSQKKTIKVLAWALGKILAPFAGHSRLLIFRCLK